MGDGTTEDDLLGTVLKADRLIKGLCHPSTWLLLAANALPIFGVLYWGWEVFVLLMLYWMETAIIGFWTIARVAITPRDSLGMLVNGRPAKSPVGMALLFTMHSSGFMAAHFAFLRSVFSGEWSQKMHSPSDFVRDIIIGTGLWIPLLAFFVARGLSFLFHALKPDFIYRLEQALHLPIFPRTPEPENVSSLVGAFYGRIMVMHATIVFNGFLAKAFGTVGPLILMIAMKTLVDLRMHLAFNFGNAKNASDSLSTARRGDRPHLSG